MILVCVCRLVCTKAQKCKIQLVAACVSSAISKIVLNGTRKFFAETAAAFVVFVFVVIFVARICFNLTTFKSNYSGA